MATRKNTPDLCLLDWNELSGQDQLRSAFRRKSSWVVHAPSSLPLWYTTVLSNLTRTFMVRDQPTIESVRSIILAGLSKASFERLKWVAGISVDELSRATDIPKRTLARRTKFKADESERILRVASLFQRALDIFDDVDKARKWFNSPKRALGNKTPLEYCDTGPGAESVEQLLGRIEHGVFT